eukprot:1904565-Pyramimonas_sp.AAC.1
MAKPSGAEDRCGGQACSSDPRVGGGRPCTCGCSSPEGLWNTMCKGAVLAMELLWFYDGRCVDDPELPIA